MPRRSAASTLEVSVINGDLSFIAEPLLVGHYTSSRLTGTERVLDRRLNGALGRSLTLGLYPSLPGTYQIFENTTPNDDNPLQDPRPRAVIVVGLGDEADLTGIELAQSVRRGVVAWVQRIVEKSGPSGNVELAGTLLGSGGLRVRVGQAAQLIVNGVLDANVSLARAGWPVVTRLSLVELYLDRATEAWRALRLLQQTAGGHLRVDDVVRDGRGSLRRPLEVGYRGTDYDVISAAIETGPTGTATLQYTLSTKRARSEVRAKTAQVSLVRQMVERASNHLVDDTDIRQALWDLLIPTELEPFLIEATDLQLELTQETAGIPWELLDTRREQAEDAKPWAVRTRLMRKLRTGTFRERPVDAGAEASVLVIGDPLTTSPLYPSLPGARREAAAVADALEAVAFDPPLRVERLFGADGGTDDGPNADVVIKTLLSREWRIVHVCAHGAERPVLAASDDATRSAHVDRAASLGIVLSDDTYLGAAEIGSLRVVPELVFLNCCHLAAGRTDDVLATPAQCPKPYDRALFAASVADALISVGVRCVIAAGWAVDDETARVFATTFYAELLAGEPFINAVATARRVTQQRGGNTWAAYQCYGDPDWTFRSAPADAQRNTPSPANEFADIGSPSELDLVLHTLATRSKYQGVPAAEQAARLRYLEERFGERWATRGGVAEGFGAAWSEVGDFERAIAWFERAHAAPDGGASLRASEQLANLRVRHAWEGMLPALQAWEQAVRRIRARTRGGHARATTALGSEARNARARVRRHAAAARDEIARALDLLTQITDLGSTAERQNLMGSAFKRLAMLEAALGNDDAAAQALAATAAHYRQALEHCQADGDANLHYPALNWLAAAVAANVGHAEWNGLDEHVVALARESLARKNNEDADFWSVSGEIQLAILAAVAKRNLGANLQASIEAFDDLRGRVPGANLWHSAYDQAHFVLDPYIRHATPDEAASASKLLAYLRRAATGREADSRSRSRDPRASP